MKYQVMSIKYLYHNAHVNINILLVIIGAEIKATFHRMTFLKAVPEMAGDGNISIIIIISAAN